VRACSVPLAVTKVLMGSDITDGGMHEMFAQVVRALFRQLICIRFRFIFSGLLSFMLSIAYSISAT
jgi:hypothetical protein